MPYPLQCVSTEAWWLTAHADTWLAGSVAGLEISDPNATGFGISCRSAGFDGLRGYCEFVSQLFSYACIVISLLAMLYPRAGSGFGD